MMTTARQRTSLRIWHWNANGFRCRKAVLQQHLQTLTPAEQPDVIMIQETHAENAPSLPGYRAHASPPSARTCGRGAAQGVCTFVRKGITFIKQDALMGNRGSAIEMCATELSVITGKHKHKSTSTIVMAVNVYSNPQHNQQRFKSLLHRARGAVSACDGAIVVACGDFNARHKELGHAATTVKGRELLEDAAEADYVLLTDPAHPTRIGTSVVKDTTPDLAFLHLPDDRTASWRNTGINLGSDHYIVEVVIPLRPNSKTSADDGRIKHRLTNWHDYRTEDLGEITDIEQWTRKVVAAVEKATSVTETSEETTRIDPRLAHMLEARSSLQRRWKRQRHNRALRKRIATLGREIEKYSRQLCAQQWFELCNEADGQLHRGGTWKLLRHLMDETQSKEYQRHRLAQIMYAATKELGEREVHKRLNERYLPETAMEQQGEYAGPPNPSLDRDIEEWEVRRATQALNCRSAAGPDRVTNKALRNLSDAAITSLTKYFNEHWRAGSLPRQWKTAFSYRSPTSRRA
ncbi:uncharacterized protein LOC144174656 [Haemaphysalis longicornis]